MRLGARGIQCLVAPVLTIRNRALTGSDIASCQALIVTSANAVPGLAESGTSRSKPVFAVGPATASALRSEGFSEVTSFGGTVRDLVDQIGAVFRPEQGSLVYASGADIAYDLKTELADRGYTVRQVIAYEAEAARSLPADVKHSMDRREFDGVVFYSARTASIFISLVQNAGLTSKMKHAIGFCLSPRVKTAAAEVSWAALKVADRPDPVAFEEMVIAVSLGKEKDKGEG